MRLITLFLAVVLLALCVDRVRADDPRSRRARACVALAEATQAARAARAEWAIAAACKCGNCDTPECKAKNQPVRDCCKGGCFCAPGAKDKDCVCYPCDCFRAKPPAATGRPQYDLWLINGQYQYLPRGQQPATLPALGGGCASGRCGVR